METNLPLPWSPLIIEGEEYMPPMGVESAQNANKSEGFRVDTSLVKHIVHQSLTRTRLVSGELDSFRVACFRREEADLPARRGSNKTNVIEITFFRYFN